MTPDGGLDLPFLLPTGSRCRWLALRHRAAVAPPVVVGIVGMGLELCLRRTYGKDPLYGLLLTFGAALVLEELIRLIWGPTRALPAGAAGDHRRRADRRPHLLQVPLLRLGLRDRDDRAAVAVPAAHALWRADQGRRA